MSVEEANVAASLHGRIPEMAPPDVGDDEYVIEADDLVEEETPSAGELQERLIQSGEEDASFFERKADDAQQKRSRGKASE